MFQERVFDAIVLRLKLGPGIAWIRPGMGCLEGIGESFEEHRRLCDKKVSGR
jgi:hypothetical protein